MPTFKIVLAYDGAGFVGWQRQASGTSVQGVIEDALGDLDGRHVKVTGAGRTDAGVHALGQAAGFSLERAITPRALVRAMNARLPESVRVLAAEQMPPAFHARFDATRKTYRYRIWNGDEVGPFERGRVWHLPGALDLDAMRASAPAIEGRHDFAAFQGAGSAAHSTEREVMVSRLSSTEDTEDAWFDKLTMSARTEPVEGRVPRVLRRGGALIAYEITGSGFLRHMVRNIVGSLVEIGRGRRAHAWLGELLASRDRSKAGPTAPPEGLFLVRVDYN